MVTTPRQLVQPPFCGPKFWSRAMFHSVTLLAQLRVAPMIRFCRFHLRLPPKSVAHSPPEHSVNQMSRSG
jgi:hypothetical protein